jgi:hypothetical protein
MICSEMTTTPSPKIAAPGIGSVEWAEPIFARQVAVLGQLAEKGLEMALDIAEEAKADDASETCVARYAKAARAVRVSLMLQSKLIHDFQAAQRKQAEADRMAAIGGKFSRTEQVEARKARLGRIVERVAGPEREGTYELERQFGEAAERLDQDDLYGDILTRPVSELVAIICQDLGLDPDWPRLAEELWAREEIASGDPGWPLAENPKSPCTPPRSASPPSDHQSTPPTACS